jgi:diguanylate cyclase (GGDEF)-like protein
MGKSIYELIPGYLTKQTQEIAETVYQQSNISNVHMETKTTTGEPLFLNISAQMLSLNQVPTYIMVSLTNVTKQMMTEHHIQKLAFMDYLTKVDNRLTFNYKLNSLVSKLSRDGGDFTMIYFDPNNFKTVNDERGHAVGDEVLVEFTRRLKNVTLGDDFIARVGGDEFVLLMENLPSKLQLARALSRLRVALNMPYQIEGGAFHQSVSMGISSFPEDGDVADVLLKKADQAMYREKLESGS